MNKIRRRGDDSGCRDNPVAAGSKTTPRRRLNTTEDGAIACAFGSPWLDHFDPPIGTGKSCAACDAYLGEDA